MAFFETATTRGWNRFEALFIWAAAFVPLDPCAPSIQTTVLEASGSSLPSRTSTTLPATVPAGAADAVSRIVRTTAAPRIPMVPWKKS